MAMVSCSECGEKISDRAPICPHCGVDNDNENSANVHISNEQIKVNIAGLPLEVKVVDIEMSFMAMVTFMVKAVFAAIPAALIVLVLGGMLTGVVATMFGR